MTYILKTELAGWKNPQMICQVYTLRRANTAMFPYHYVQVLLISQIKTYEHCIFSLKIPFRHKFPRISSWWLCFSLYFWIIKEHNLIEYFHRTDLFKNKTSRLAHHILLKMKLTLNNQIKLMLNNQTKQITWINFSAGAGFAKINNSPE